MQLFSRDGKIDIELKKRIMEQLVIYKKSSKLTLDDDEEVENQESRQLRFKILAAEIDWFSDFLKTKTGGDLEKFVGMLIKFNNE